MAEVQHWTETQQEEYKKKYPLSHVEPWVVMDEGLVYSFCSTEEEALSELRGLQMRDEIGGSYLDWVEETANKLSVPLEAVKQVVRERY